jgi:hypothetical protein
MIQGIVMKNGNIFITSNIEKIVPDDYNDPDLEITQPHLVEKVNITNSITLKPFLGDYTNQTIFSFRTEDVLTLFSPTESLIEEYKQKTGVQEQLELKIEEDLN